MSYARSNKRNVVGSIIGVLVVAGIAIWQFYLFVAFTGADGLANAQGGRIHLWFAIAMAVCACGAAFLVFSAFVRHDASDDLHITSPPELWKERAP